MSGDYKNSEDSTGSNLFRRGVPGYYLGSMFFAAGIILMGIGTALIIFFQLHYGSNPEEIMYTVLSIGLGITFIMIGINLMIRQKSKGYVIVTISAFLSFLAIFLFYTNFLTNWYYPLIGYVFGLYVLSFMILIGNAFANVILWIIDRRPEISSKGEEQSKIYTDEEIQRDIEEATRKSIELAASNLQFEIDSLPESKRFDKLVMGVRGQITRVKDDITEAIALNQTMHPGSTEKWGSIGIDQASLQLAKTVMEKKEEQGIFARFKGYFSNKFSKS